MAKYRKRARVNILLLFQSVFCQASSTTPLLQSSTSVRLKSGGGGGSEHFGCCRIYADMWIYQITAWTAKNRIMCKLVFSYLCHGLIDLHLMCHICRDTLVGTFPTKLPIVDQSHFDLLTRDGLGGSDPTPPPFGPLRPISVFRE